MARTKATYVVLIPVEDGWEFPEGNLKGEFDSPKAARAALFEHAAEGVKYDIHTIHAAGLTLKPRETKRTKMVLVQ